MILPSWIKTLPFQLAIRNLRVITAAYVKRVSTRPTPSSSLTNLPLRPQSVFPSLPRTTHYNFTDPATISRGHPQLTTPLTVFTHGTGHYLAAVSEIRTSEEFHWIRVRQGEAGNTVCNDFLHKHTWARKITDGVRQEEGGSWLGRKGTNGWDGLSDEELVRARKRCGTDSFVDMTRRMDDTSHRFYHNTNPTIQRFVPNPCGSTPNRSANHIA